MGKEAVTKGLIEGTGTKVVAADWESREEASQFSYGVFLQV